MSHKSRSSISLSLSLSFFKAWVLFIAAAAFIAPASLSAQVGVLTNRNNNGRTSLYDSETFLTPANVKSATFAKLGAYNVDGYVVAQPLYMPNVSIGGVLHNIVIVATQHDSVYAFDADNLSSGIPLWQQSFINPAAGITTVPVSEQGCSVVNGYTEIGIQGTPVIDPSNGGTLYVDVKTKEVTNGVTSYVHRLHALDVTSGAEKFNGPVAVTGSVSSLHGPVTFDSLKACQRPGLLLTNGTVYVAFGSNGCDNAHGWVFAYSATDLSMAPKAFNTSPNQAKQGAIWQGGAGLAADDAGNVFFITANGTFDVNMGGSDYGDTFMKMSLGSSLSVTDYFTPFDQAHMSVEDLDLGSGGGILLSDPTWTYPNEMIGAGKTGTIYVVNRDNMGHYLPNDNSQIIQWMQDALNRVDGTPAYWNGNLYFAPAHAKAVAYALPNGQLPLMPFAFSQSIIPLNGPVVSSNGNSNGVVWILRKIGNTSGKQLSAFDGLSMQELYNTTQAGSRDALGATAHLIVPTIANGKTYVGTQTQLVVYGLMPPILSVSGGNQTGTAGSTLPLPLTVQVTDAYTGAPISGVNLTFSGKGTFGTPNPVTDSTGTASTTYTLPTTFTTSTVTITVSSTGYASATFTETVTAGNPASVAYVSGGSQTGVVGSTLPTQLIFKVADQFGNAVPGASVTFADTPNHGIFSGNPVSTDSTGKARVSYTLPTKAGFTTVTPSIGSLVGPNIQEHGIAGSAASVVVSSGNNQTAHVNTALPKPLMVRVADQYGNPVAGVAVTYSDNSSGVFSGNPAVTNSGGQAGVSYTTPGTAGTVTINATVTGLSPAVFTVHVTN